MTFLMITLIFGIVLFLWMHQIETRRFELNRHDFTIRKKLPRSLKILHLTDTHFSEKNPGFSKFFDHLAKENFDFVFLSGDIMDCEEGIFACMENLKKLKPAIGFYAVFGNHDYYDYRFLDAIIHNFPGQTFPRNMNRVDLFKQELKKIGVHVLRNETVSLDVEGAPILIHGLDNATTGHANIRKTMENFDPSKINFLLTHTIDVFLDIGEGEIDISFSGHSHGGQVCLPFLGPVLSHTTLGRQYASGVWNIQGAVCCIGRGMSSNRFMRLRLCCAPEAILATVHGI